MHKSVIRLLVIAFLCCGGCAGWGEGDGEGMLAEAVDATMVRGSALKGHIRVAVSDQVVLQRESAFFDPEQVRGNAGHSGEPQLETALIGIEDLGSAASEVTVERSQEDGSARVLTLKMDSGRVKDQLRRYFASHRHWLEQKYGSPAAAGTESSGVEWTAIQAEEQKWEELLDQLEAEAVYRLKIDPEERHIVQVDVETVLRYNKDGTMIEEHIHAAYETEAGSDPSGGRR